MYVPNPAVDSFPTKLRRAQRTALLLQSHCVPLSECMRVVCRVTVTQGVKRGRLLWQLISASSNIVQQTKPIKFTSYHLFQLSTFNGNNYS